MDWKYKWVSEDAPANGSPEPTLLYLYIRTIWQPASDGMPKPYSEILGYIQYNPKTQLWAVFHHKGDTGVVAVNKSHWDAMRIIEDFVKQKILKS